MTGRSAVRRRACFTAILLALGCSVLPRSSGKVLALDAATLAKQDLIRYRPLRAEDFLAASIPKEVRASKHTVGAYTCLTLMHEGPIAVAPLPDNSRMYKAELVQVAFRAYMNRDCSWLNREAPLPPSYVLEHEQIHFGIWELHARQLNAQPERIRAQVRSLARNAEAAVEATKKKIAAVLEQALEDLRKENLAFDDDTSRGYYPEAQKRWFKRVQTDLNHTKP